MKNYIDLISSDLNRASQEAMVIPERIGAFRIKSANQTLQDASTRPNPQPLWESLWYEGELCCLFADSNVGKSLYAVQIASKIAETQRVLYFDFELSDKQFQLRYSDENGQLHTFPNDLYRVEMDDEDDGEDESIEDASDSVEEAFETVVLSNIINAVNKTGAKVLIIDNLTYLCVASEKGDLAGLLMKKLKRIKKKYQLSILVLAHTPKRPLSNIITQNDLAGSKKLYNFFDSVFAIGKSAKDSSVRYVKQLKVRHGCYEYDSENVIVYRIEKVRAFTQFVFVGYADEHEHLKELSEDDKEQLTSRVLELRNSGLSYRVIADKVGTNLAKVQRILNRVSAVSNTDDTHDTDDTKLL